MSVASKRKVDEELEANSTSPAKRQFPNHVEIIFSVLGVILRHSPNLILCRAALACVCRAFYKQIATFEDRTPQQKEILDFVKATHLLPYPVPELIPSTLRVSTGPGTGKTEIMIEGAVERTLKGEQVAILARSAIFYKFNDVLEKLRRRRNWLICPTLMSVGVFRGTHAPIDYPVILLIPLLYNQSLSVLYMHRLHTTVIFTDDYVGKRVPKAVASYAEHMKQNAGTPVELNFIAFSASNTGAQLNAVTDANLELPELDITIEITDQCWSCAACHSTTQQCSQGGAYNSIDLMDRAPQLFARVFETVVAKQEKLLFVYNPEDEYAQTKLKQLFTLAKSRGWVEKFYIYNRPSDFSKVITKFNATTTTSSSSSPRFVLVLPWKADILRGHDILASSMIIFNGFSPHRLGHSITPYNSKYHFQPPKSLNPESAFQLLGRVRRPNNTHRHIPVFIFDSVPEIIIVIASIARTNFTLKEANILYQKFMFYGEDDERDLDLTEIELRTVSNIEEKLRNLAQERKVALSDLHLGHEYAFYSAEDAKVQIHIHKQLLGMAMQRARIREKMLQLTSEEFVRETQNAITWIGPTSVTIKYHN